jgi:DNA-binding CsgD family transcriptional regulator
MDEGVRDLQIVLWRAEYALNGRSTENPLAAVFGVLAARYEGKRDGKVLAHRGAVVAGMLGDGRSVDEIAERLGVGARTVKRDVQVLRRMYGVDRLSRVESRRGP